MGVHVHGILAQEGGPLEVVFGSDEVTYLWVILIISLLALAFAYYLVREVLAAPEGTEKMKEIARAIQEGAKAYLSRQFRTLGIFLGILTVLLFFLSSCPTCHRMLPEWNRAFERRPRGLNVVAVMLDREPPGWFTVNPVAFPVVRSPGREFLDAYRVHRVPVTVRVGAGGKVTDVGRGLLDPIRLGELFRPPG